MSVALRLAVAGAGVIGRAHLQRIVASPDCAVHSVVDPTPAAKSLAADLGVPWYADLAAMLSEERPLADGVILATPNALHVPGALQCIDAGVPVLVEKPIADTVADAQRLADTARRTGVPVLVGHHRRHGALMDAACRAVRSGRLGRLVSVTGSATFVKPDSYFTDAPWRTQLGGGPILINLIHEIDNLRALVGNITAVQAMASSATRGFEVEDTVAISLRFANGVLGSFLLSDCAASPRSWEQTSAENTAYDHHADQDCYVLAGTHGSLQVPTLSLYEFEGERSWFAPMRRQSLPVDTVDPLVRQLAHFCAVIRGQAEPLVSADEGLATLRAALAVAEAARTGQLVSLA